MDNLHHHYSTQTMGSAEKNNPDMENKKLLARTPTKDEVVHCPRCDSPNTKFCYYNNYSLSQPRYFCKGCRRYWTQGGTLRNVPVGGGSRKNRRPLPSPSSIDSSNFTDPPSIANNFNFHNHQNPSSVSTGHHELNIGFPSSSQNSHYHDVVSKGITLIESSGNPSDFQFPGGFANSSLDNSGFASFHRGLPEGSSDGGARVLFPAEDLKPVEQNHDDGYWSSGGSW